MIEIKEKKDCCGCAACASVCPQKCITMTCDEEGFQYPVVAQDQCVHCGRCEKVCPFRSYQEPENELSDRAFAVQYKGAQADTVLKKCASGGAFTAFSEHIVSQGGVSFGAAFDENMVVHHCQVSDNKDVFRHSSSKYVQSEMRDCMLQVECELRKGIKVLFSGTPCQVVGLKKFLRKDYENLICVEVICAGVASPKVLSEYLDLKTKEKSPVTGINFKYKKFGYHSCTMAYWQNEKVVAHSMLTDEMMRVFCAHIADRPSCGSCAVKGLNRYSDLSIFDCWHFTKLTGKPDDDRGHTSIIPHSQKGLDLLSACSDILTIEPVDLELSIKLDGNMVRGVQHHHAKREEFFAGLNVAGLAAAIDRCIPFTVKDRILEVLKGILYRLGILRLVKGIVRGETV